MLRGVNLKFLSDLLKIQGLTRNDRFLNLNNYVLIGILNGVTNIRSVSQRGSSLPAGFLYLRNSSVI